ncbi:CPBP family intramembrane glutamic endopeptidase [Halolamina sp. C58]|uniref:CPBP family intramembrane glutamic endopeptidase n=1 Tax=Halolamina sp. C58 TaxID=3421640 RepID=UPI003EB84A32
MPSTNDSSNGQSDSHSTLRPIGAAVGLAVAGFAVNVGGGFVGGVIAALTLGPEAVLNDSTLRFALGLPGQVLVFGFALGYLRWRSLDLPVSLPSRNQSLLVGASVVASVAAAFGLTFLREALSGGVTSTIGGMVSATPALALWIGVASVLLIAPAEELLFRGAVQGRLGEQFGTWPAVAGASTLFAGWHLLNFDGTALGTLLAAGVVGAVSLLWGYAYERTENFAVPVLTHGLYNLTLMAIAYAQLTA